MAETSSPVAPAQPYRCGSFIRRSPKARETASPQRTLRPPNCAGLGVKTRQTPCMSTRPPTDSIRRRSSALPGLWSSERRTAERRPPCERHSTARESPRLAISNLNLPPLLSSCHIRPVIMVEPSRTSRSRALVRNSSSVRIVASVTACFRCSSVSAGFAEMHFWRFLGSRSTASSQQRLPEWPSRTQKPTMRWPPGPLSSMSIM
mmetsp:Transcript_60174/g.176587  ORF Transcript_60174/g.176587 Transcript_60174/m.176587 type:complete len:205 (-) Transcript_60174:597-1211(-)